MYYYELTYTDETQNIAIRSLIPNLTVEEANKFCIATDGEDGFLKDFGPIINVSPITKEEVHHFYDDSNIDNWPIAVRSDTLWEEYKKYQTQWMIEHGYTIRDLIEYLIEFDREWGEDVSFQTLYNQWLKNSGFGGEIWACFDEWKEYEGKIFVEV